MCNSTILLEDKGDFCEYEYKLSTGRIGQMFHLISWMNDKIYIKQ